MEEVEKGLLLLAVAVALTAFARRIRAPYPALLSLLGAVLVFVPGVTHVEMQPQLALTLFVAPVLLDAAFDSSARDLRRHWLPIAGLVVAAVGGTVIAVSATVKAMAPNLPWGAAIALGAIVAPPDAAAAAAVLKRTPLPSRLSRMLEGESLLNDVSALLIYRLAVVSVTTASFKPLPSIALMLAVVIGSVVAGLVLARVIVMVLGKIEDVPSSIVMQFVSTFGVWIASEKIGLSGILTMVVYAIALAQRTSRLQGARVRLPSYAVWETVVFVLNVLAFVLIGLQLGPILDRLGIAQRWAYAEVAMAVLGVCVAVRFAWVLVYGLVIRRVPSMREDRLGMKDGIVIGWSGMRGIVTLAAALALPGGDHPFPGRDLILLTAFVVVLGTLVIQGLTLGPLLVWFALEDDGQVERETVLARRAVGDARHALLQSAGSDVALALLSRDGDAAAVAPLETRSLKLATIATARSVLIDLRHRETIGNDAFRVVQLELDQMEMMIETIRE